MSVSASSSSMDHSLDPLEKLRETRPEAFVKLTRMHLLINIDCPGDSLSTLFDDEPSSDKENTLTTEMIRRMNKLIEFIRRDQNIVEEGIFRRCGSLVRQQELKSKLIHGFPLDLDAGQYNVHDCANVLKTFLSELSDPLLSDRFYTINCQIVNNDKSVEKDAENSPSIGAKKLKKLQILMVLLPLHVRRFVEDLLTLLKQASEHCDKNKMDAKNFATMFAPHLLFPRNLKAAEMHQHLTILTDELQFMIENVNLIFKPPKELLLDAKRELQKPVDNGNADDAVDTVLTFCVRDNLPKESETAKHLAELYAYISSMPETPKKKSLIKSFNRQNGGITPISMKREDSVKDRANNMLSVFRKGLQKGLNFLPGSRGTPTKISIGSSPSSSTEKCSLIKSESLRSWSPDSESKDMNSLGSIAKRFKNV